MPAPSRLWAVAAITGACAAIGWCWLTAREHECRLQRLMAFERQTMWLKMLVNRHAPHFHWLRFTDTDASVFSDAYRCEIRVMAASESVELLWLQGAGDITPPNRSYSYGGLGRDDEDAIWADIDSRLS